MHGKNKNGPTFKLSAATGSRHCAGSYFTIMTALQNDIPYTSSMIYGGVVTQVPTDSGHAVFTWLPKKLVKCLYP